MAISISSGALTTIVGLAGVMIGTLIGPYINHKLTIKNTKKDIIFKRKLEYFEKLAENIEKNIRTYRNSIKGAENNLKKPQLKKIYQRLKKERKNFLIMASPLYFNIRGLSERIISFVEVEKEIFKNFEKLSNFKDKKQAQEIIFDLNDRLKRLIALGNRAVYEMKKELHK
jgi:hypothetical protein